MTNFSKDKKLPPKIENPNPTGNSVCGNMKPVKAHGAAKMGLTKTGGENHRGKA